MKLLIESTELLVHLDGVPCRVWRGCDEDGGDPYMVFVHRIASDDLVGQRKLAAEFEEMAEPDVRPWQQEG